MLILKFFIVYTLLSVIICSSFSSTSHSKIIFIAPKESNKDIQLNNYKGEFVKHLQNGWYIEANNKNVFTVYLKLNYQEVSKNPAVNETIIADKKRDVSLSERLMRHIRGVGSQEGMHESNSSVINEDVENHINYLYFTVNKDNCFDYMNYSHIPIVLSDMNDKHHRGNLLFKIDIEFTLKYEPTPYYLCLSSQPHDSLTNHTILFNHQGTGNTLTIVTYENYVPLYFELLIYIFMVILYGIFNGLNLGLMSLSVEELELLIKTSDSAIERKYAQNILPLRRQGNRLLCTILFSIALSGSISILVLDDLVEGLLAGLISTLILCIIGEIIPQAIFSRHSLPIGSYMKNFTFFFIYITSLLSYPLSKIVDYFLGQEVPTRYNKNYIKELIKKSKGLLDKQCQIISATLDFNSRKVGDTMVSLDKVYMVPETDRLTFENMLQIYNSGYSRIPVYQNNNKQDIIGLLHIKDLTLIDPEDEIEIKTLISFYKHHVAYCYDTDNLGKMFEIFRNGLTHMAFVLKLVENEDTDPYEKLVGIITLHDVIEALVQFNIDDELNMCLNSKSSYGINYLKKLIKNHKRNKSSINIDKRLSAAKNEAFDSSESLHSNSTTSSERNNGYHINLQTKLNVLQILTSI